MNHRLKYCLNYSFAHACRGKCFLRILMVGLLCLSSSCTASKFSQCQKIASITQQIADESEQYHNIQQPEGVLPIISAFEETATALERLRLADETLQSVQTELIQIYRDNAKVTREFLEAITQKDVILARTLRQRVGEIGQAEQRWVTEMNQYCQEQISE